MADIWAKNATGEKRRFTERTWELLGKNKEGWVAMEDHVIHNVAIKNTIPKPSNGQKAEISQRIENLKKIEPVQVIDNNKFAGFNAQEEAFFKAADGINRSKIKDYFDRQNVEYKNTLNTLELTRILGKHLNYDTIELQKAFSI